MPVPPLDIECVNNTGSSGAPKHDPRGLEPQTFDFESIASCTK